MSSCTSFVSWSDMVFSHSVLQLDDGCLACGQRVSHGSDGYKPAFSFRTQTVKQLPCLAVPVSEDVARKPRMTRAAASIVGLLLWIELHGESHRASLARQFLQRQLRGLHKMQRRYEQKMADSGTDSFPRRASGPSFSRQPPVTLATTRGYLQLSKNDCHGWTY